MKRPWLIGCAIVCLLAAALVVSVIALAVLFSRELNLSPLQTSPVSASIDPADPDQLPPIQIGDRVEALSTDGWQPARVIALAGKNEAEVVYDSAILANERLDLKLLRPAATPFVDDPESGRPSTKVPAGASASPRVGSILSSSEIPSPPGTPISTNTIAAKPVRDVPTPTVESAYLGCFNDTSTLELNGYLERSPANTPENCIRTCRERGFAYAGVQYGESCLCGDQYGRYGQSDNCNYPCTGDPTQTCGGYGTNAIYKTGKQQ